MWPAGISGSSLPGPAELALLVSAVAVASLDAEYLLLTEVE